MNQVLEEMFTYDPIKEPEFLFHEIWNEEAKQSQIIGNHYTRMALNSERNRMTVHEFIELVDPVSAMVNTCGTGKLSQDALSALLREVFPLSPKGIIDHLKLLQPVYLKTAAYGHFGRSDVEFTCERVDATNELLAKV